MKDIRRDVPISSLRVRNLFGRFNHELVFGQSEGLTILTAPNGFGKTVLLRIIYSFFNRNLSIFRTLRFDEIIITLTSGQTISIREDRPELFGDDDVHSPRIVLIQANGFQGDDDAYVIPSGLSPPDIRYLERNFPLEHLSGDRWYDHSVEKSISADQVAHLYSDQLPERSRIQTKMPEWLLQATASANVHLVETQRLLYLDEEPQRRPLSRRYRMTPPSVVEKDAADLAEKISRLLQEYANESQKLDQTFPKRILAPHSNQVSSEDEIRTQLQELNKKRSNLVSVGLLGQAISEPIQPSDIFQEERIRNILEIYVEDTRKKLGIFDETYAKIRLFKEILDEHFSFKSIAIEPKKGITAKDIDTDSDIPLSDLSSGEQHELVLIYELLFKVEDGSLILIDEPELSLHVAWQKRFISDLQKIQQLKDISVLIATHSPQIIHDRWDLVQDLTAPIHE